MKTDFWKPLNDLLRKELLSRDLHPHMFRHSRLQHMADEGVDSFAIKSYAGHSDIGTTQIYVKASKYQRQLAFYKNDVIIIHKDDLHKLDINVVQNNKICII